MCVRHFQSSYHHTYPKAFHFITQYISYPLSECVHMRQIFIIHIEDVVYLHFRNHECMPEDDRTNIKEGKTPIILRYFVARYLSGNDFRKYSRHDPALEKDVKDFKVHLATWCLDSSNFTNLFAKQATTNGAANRDFTQFEIGFRL